MQVLEALGKITGRPLYVEQQRARLCLKKSVRALKEAGASKTAKRVKREVFGGLADITKIGDNSGARGFRIEGFDADCRRVIFEIEAHTISPNGSLSIVYRSEDESVIKYRRSLLTIEENGKKIEEWRDKEKVESVTAEAIRSILKPYSTVDDD
ncbi:MAG: hypothetical protein M1268_04525 [Patescibacteria group bacterium]|nr:hypothetical protein [Patescibacteria group bacterium]